MVLPWSHADSRPHIPQGRATGLFIWHDRNTVHVETTDNHWFGDTFEGAVEIKGGKFDNVQGERSRADTRFRQVASNRLIFHIGQDGHRTGRIYYGESKTPSFQDPVVFNLNN